MTPPISRERPSPLLPLTTTPGVTAARLEASAEPGLALEAAPVLAPPVPRVDPKLTAALVRGGLTPEEAERILRDGITAREATDLLTSKMVNPSLSDYGPALGVISLVAAARQRGALSPSKAREIVQLQRSMVVVRPDGYLVRVQSGEPIERAAGRVDLTGPTPKIGTLELGTAYALQSGVIYAVDEDLRPGHVAGELSLDRGMIGAALDGVEAGVLSMLQGVETVIRGFIEDPDATLYAMGESIGTLDQTIAKIIVSSPERLQSFLAMTPQDRARAVSEAATALTLSIAAAKLVNGGIASAEASVSGGLLARAGGLGFEATLGIEAAAAGFAIAQLTAGGALLGGLLAPVAQDPLESRRRDPATAHGKWQLDRQIDRTFNDPRSELVPLDELAVALKQAAEIGPDLAARYLELAKQRLARELHAIDGLPSARTKQARAALLRKVAGELDIDLRETLLPDGPRPPLSSLSKEAQTAVRAIRSSERSLHVSSRAVAEEVLSQFGELVETPHWPKSRIRQLFRNGEDLTYHWDVEMEESGVLRHHDAADVHGRKRHLELHLEEDVDVRVFFEGSS